MHPASLYLLLWTTGCAVGFVAALLVLRRRGALAPATVLAVAVAWLLLFVGSKWHWRLEHLPWIEALVVSPADIFAPGRRLPLGLLASAMAAALACVVLRRSWRDVGDACAVFWSALIPIGRLGCLAYGCCVGTTCPSWLAPLCWRYGPGSEPFHLQLEAGTIPPESPLSLPVHPLPLYFALASLGTLGVLVWLLRRAAPPGTLLLTFAVLRPATKLTLEPLRAEPAPSWLMVGIPAVTLVAALAVAVPLLARRIRLARRRRLAPAALLALALLVAAAPPVRAEEPRWSAALARYAQDPLRNRRALRRLEREGRDDFPPAVLLALADARLRGGAFAAAERLFARAAAAAPDEPLATWAAFGRAWAGLLAGGSAPPPPSDGPLAAVLGGLVHAAQSRPDDAERSFARVEDDPRAAPALRAAARLAAAYARHWAAGDAAATVAAFDAAVAAADGTLVDDARYGAARARLRAGDHHAARAMLRDLAAWHGNGRPMPVTPALVGLERDAVLRAAFARYRRAPVRAPEAQLHAMLDGDGAALARAALRALGEPVAEPRHAPLLRRPRPRPVAAVRSAPPAVRTLGVPEPPRRGLPALDTIAVALRPVLLLASLVAVGLGIHEWFGGRYGRRME